MIHWRTDVENAPRDGTPFLVPNPFPPLNGVESGIYLNKWFREIGKAPAQFGVEFTHWSEINLP